MVTNKLARDTNGNQERGGGEPQARTVTDIRIARFRLVGGHVNDVILLQPVIRGKNGLSLIQIQRHDFLLSVRTFTNQSHVVTKPPDGHVARHGQCFEQVHFLIADGECSGTGDFSDYGDFVVYHTNRYYRRFLYIGFQFFHYHLYYHNVFL